MMIRQFLKRMLFNSKEIFFYESRNMNGFMGLLMKPRNTGDKWTPEEKTRLKYYLRDFSFYIPVVIVFVMPGGFLLLPLLATLLDRRRTRREPVLVRNLPDGQPYRAR